MSNKNESTVALLKRVQGKNYQLGEGGRVPAVRGNEKHGVEKTISTHDPYRKPPPRLRGKGR